MVYPRNVVYKQRYQQAVVMAGMMLSDEISNC